MHALPLSSTGDLQGESPCSSKIGQPQGVYHSPSSTGVLGMDTEELFFPKKNFLADWCFLVFSQTSLMDRGEIGKLPTFVNIPAAHRCNQGTSKRVMGVVNVIMVGGSRFFCLAPCLYVWNSFNLVVVVVLATPTGPSRVAGADQPPG